MRSWESEPRPIFLGGRADSQDRMDQVGKLRRLRLIPGKDDEISERGDRQEHFLGKSHAPLPLTTN